MIKKKNDNELKITAIDRLGFKFLPMTETPEFQFFLQWLLALRGEMNQIDKVIKKLTVDPMKNEIEAAGIKAMILRSKVQSLDDIVNMAATLKVKYKQEIEKEASNAE